MEIVEKVIPDQKVAYVPHTDSFAKLPEYLKEVGELIAENNFEVVGYPYGSYENDLEERAETTQMFEVGMPIKDFDAGGKPAARIEKLGLKEVASHTVLSTIHRGSRKNFNESVKAVVEYAVENGYDIIGPITEIYYPSAVGAPVEDNKYEIQLPVIFMGKKEE